jgi:hypothetical protein
MRRRRDYHFDSADNFDASYSPEDNYSGDELFDGSEAGGSDAETEATDRLVLR